MKIRVAIIDDHQLIIDGIKSILSDEIDIDIVIEANDGIEFLRKMKGQEVDVVLSDVRMPKMDGFTLIKTLREQNSAIPVLILSMFDQPTDIREFITAGARGFIPKNIARDELIKAIRSLYIGQTYFPKKYESSVSDKEQDDQNNQIILSKREKEILRLIAKGRSSLEISQELFISKYTVDTHRKNIHKKLNITGHTSMVKYSIENYS